jgi:hypothetical protein
MAYLNSFCKVLINPYSLSEKYIFDRKQLVLGIKIQKLSDSSQRIREAEYILIIINTLIPLYESSFLP